MRSKTRFLSRLTIAYAMLLISLVLAFAGAVLAASDIVIDGDFADWTDGDGNEFCVDDQGGNDDWNSPATSDITKQCVATNQSDTLYLLFGFDDITLSGGNNSSACVLMDTDQPANGYYDYTLCVTLQGPGSTSVQSVTLYTCDDTSGSGCSGASSSKTYTSSSYGFDNTENGPWNTDSLLEIAVPYTDLGVTNGDILLSALHSFPDESTLTAPKDSVFGTASQATDQRIRYDTDDGTGSITGPTAITLSSFLARSVTDTSALAAWLVSGTVIGIAVLGVTIALWLRYQH